MIILMSFIVINIHTINCNYLLHYLCINSQYYILLLDQLFLTSAVQSKKNLVSQNNFYR